MSTDTKLGFDEDGEPIYVGTIVMSIRSAAVGWALVAEYAARRTNPLDVEKGGYISFARLAHDGSRTNRITSKFGNNCKVLLDLGL